MRHRGVKVGPMYNPCVIAHLLQPELFKRRARVPVDIDGFYRLLEKQIGRLP